MIQIGEIYILQLSKRRRELGMNDHYYVPEHIGKNVRVLQAAGKAMNTRGLDVMEYQVIPVDGDESNYFFAWEDMLAPVGGPW